jgi:hypothetical protein
MGDFKYLLNQTFNASQFNIASDFRKFAVKPDQYAQPIAGYVIQPGAVHDDFINAASSSTN